MVALRGEANLYMLISTMNRCGRGRGAVPGRVPTVSQDEGGEIVELRK